MSGPELYIHPSRPRMRVRPFKVMSHMKQLIADKEDTKQVFFILRALNGDALRKNLERSVSSPEGRARWIEKLSLAPRLDDHASFGDLAPGTVGRAYIEFMKREGLTASGLVEESEIRLEGEPRYEDDIEWYGNRLRDTHDMFHVLSGYGRDGLGEAALLLFSAGQNPNRGASFISFMGFREMQKVIGNHVDLRAVRKEARENGRRAKKIADQDILAMLDQPIADVRERLKIPKPIAYKEALATLAEMPDFAQNTSLVV